MKNTFRQIFRSSKFVVGFVIIMFLLVFITVYPLFVPNPPLEMIGLNSFFKPGLYVSTYDAINTQDQYTMKLPGADDVRLEQRLKQQDRVDMRDWLVAFGIPAEQIDITDTDALLSVWRQNYDSSVRLDGMTSAKRRAYERLNENLMVLMKSQSIIIAERDAETGELVQESTVDSTAYVNTRDVANARLLPLGTDNFGRDVLTELVSALKTSLGLGLLAGTIATLIGLAFGLLAGYIGGWIDDIIMFIANLFTVIPPFILLILISYSIGQSSRGVGTVAVVIGVTSWVWTTRSVRAQVISLRNRDHVNLSKLSGHSLVRIIMTDILPYIASYVVMALILQISTAILAEAQLSMLGLGPRTTDMPTLGLMMYWGMAYAAHLNGSWWAYFPVILVIALVSFSLNLMNTGLDQVFNPTLRD